MSSDLLRFANIIKRLRDPEDGCPWDLKQTHQSLKKSFLEEVYEFLHEIEHGDEHSMEEELGDVLLQIYLHARLLEEKTNGRINIGTVARSISEKMIRRHPHVFADNVSVSTSKDVERNWQKIKEKEKKPVVVDEFEEFKNFPLLQKMERIYKNIKRQGFRFETPEDALKKVDEESAEIWEELNSGQAEKAKEEFGDLFLAMFSAAIEFGYSPEELLLSSFGKFRKRWTSYRGQLSKQNKDLRKMSFTEKQQLWDLIKNQKD